MAVARREVLVRDPGGEACARYGAGAEAEGRMPLLASERVSLESGHRPVGRLESSANEEDVLLVKIEAPAVRCIRELEPVMEVLAHVFDDVPL